jgi:2-hydroxychromene-2-carboxylate isomerase
VLDFYYDVVCPYAYMAFSQLDELPPVQLRPVLLGGLLRAAGGPDDPNKVQSPPRARLTRLDIQRCADLLGVPLELPDAHPMRTVDAMRLVVAAPPERTRAVTADLYRAYWVDGEDVRRREVLEAVARRHGIDPAAIGSDAARQGLFAATAAAAAAGVFGVPTFVGARELVWGQDRIGLLRRFLGEDDLDLSAWIPFAGRSVADARVVFFHDVASPFSYLAATQIDRVAARHGAVVQWSPMLLGALFRAIGTADVPLFTMHERKRAWTNRDVELWAEAWGVPYRFPTHFPIRSVLPQRAMLVDPSVAPIVYRAAWAEDRRVDDPAALEEILTAEGRPGRDIVEAASAVEIKAALRTNTALAQESGVCGVPTWQVHRPGLPPLLLWGQDRLVMLNAALQGWTPPSG